MKMKRRRNLQKVENRWDECNSERCEPGPFESRTPCTTQRSPTRNVSPSEVPISEGISDRDEDTCLIYKVHSSTPDSATYPNLYGCSTSRVKMLRDRARTLYLNDYDEEMYGRGAELNASSDPSVDESAHAGWIGTIRTTIVSPTNSSKTPDHKTNYEGSYHCDSSLSSSESNPIPRHEHHILRRNGRDELPLALEKHLEAVDARPLKIRPGDSGFVMPELSHSDHYLSASTRHHISMPLLGSSFGRRVTLTNIFMIILLYSTTTFLLLLNKFHSLPSFDLKESVQLQAMKRETRTSESGKSEGLQHHEHRPKLHDITEIHIKRSLGGVHLIHDVDGDKDDANWQKKKVLELGQLDIAMYGEPRTRGDARSPRVVYLNNSFPLPTTRRKRRMLKVERTPFSDNTQLYSILHSDDEKLSKMEIVQTQEAGDECKSDSWQREYHPSCNSVHEFDLLHLDDAREGGRLQLFKKQGYWRNAWKLELPSNEKRNERETYILKTPKYIHNFEHAFYETDRIDALAMSTLTFSPHVIDMYSFCGRTVLTEFAGGPSLGSVFDKAKKLKRLEIARDLAAGMSHVHYGQNNSEDNALFTHFDINPANVVVTNKRTLRINDFNIAQMMKRNQTSGKQCSLPHHHFPNPQWRSPEEVNEFDHLSAKVDVFSLGHIFYRIICGHEPWNRLEQGRKPSAEVLRRKVKAGILPRVPQEIMESTDPVVVAIRKAMFMCYTVDIMKRPSSKAIATFLDVELKHLSTASTT